MYTAIYTHSFQATKTQEKCEDAQNILQANLTDLNSRAKLTSSYDITEKSQLAQMIAQKSEWFFF